MIDEGEAAPTFELPGVRDGRIEQITLSEYLDDEIVILAFYPGDFNPACSGGTTDLDELDLFAMQKDVSVLAVSADSVYSHRAFAEEYDLHVPLLSDVRGEVASAYGVAVEDESVGHLTHRAVVVLGPRGGVEYSWVAGDVEELPDVEELRDALHSVSGQDTALASYRVGHAHYIEGRRAFTSAINAYEETEWMMANSDFNRAYEAFDEAEDKFNTAARFAEEGTSRTYFERAERKAEALWRAAEWLADSASDHARDQGAPAESLRSDAEAPLETARDIQEPPPPEEFPPDEDPAESEDSSIDPDTEEDVLLDRSVEAAEDTGGAGAGTIDANIPRTDAGDSPPATADGTPTTGVEGARAGDDGTEGGHETGGRTPDEGAGIDEAELEEITAELEEQTGAAGQKRHADGVDDEQRAGTDADGDGDDGDNGEVELNLTDPSDGEGDGGNESDEFGGDHGVPDSL